MTLTIDKFGRVLIPKSLRQHLHVEPGDELQVEIKNETPAIILSCKPTQTEEYDAEIIYTDWGLPMIKTSGSFPENYDTVTAIKQNYQEYFDRKFGNS